MDNHRPLSSTSYESWRKSIRLQSELVSETQTRDGGKALRLETAARGPFQPNAIVEAELVVRTEDWHPVEQRLRVQPERGTIDYNLYEAAYDVIARNTLSATLFGDLSVLQQPVALPHPSAEANAQSPSPAALVTAEMEAWYRLHLARACVGEPVSVVTAGRNRIEVQGVVATTERKTELSEALKDIPFVSVKIHTVTEDGMQAASSRVRVQNETGMDSSFGKLAPIELQSGELATQDLSEQYFVRRGSVAHSGQEQYNNEEKDIRQKVAAFSQEVVSISESTIEQAWALRRLAEWQHSWTTGLLPLSAQKCLALMVTDHLSGLKAELSRSRSLLEPVLLSLLTNAAGLPSEMEEQDLAGLQQPENRNWTAETLRLFATIEETKRLTLALFANISSPAKDRASAMSALVSALGSTPKEFEVLELRVSRGLPGRTDSITYKTGSELGPHRSPSSSIEPTNQE